MADGAALEPATTLAVAFLGLLGVTVPPIVLALLNRGGKATTPNVRVDVVSDLDDLNDRLTAENKRLTAENARLRDLLDRRERP